MLERLVILKPLLGTFLKIKPGPDETTLLISCPVVVAKLPRIANVNTPATKQVMVLTTHVIIASLYVDLVNEFK